MTLEFRELLDYLAVFPPNGRFQKWYVASIGGGHNNKLYRATSNAHDVAVKFTIRDARRRAWREFQALTAVQQHAPQLAPRPLFLDEASYTHPVVIQQWVEGDVVAETPQTDAEWQACLAHGAVLATLTPAVCSLPIEPALFNFATPQQGWESIQAQLALTPMDHHPPQMAALLRIAKQQLKRPFPASKVALCHVDPNTLNYIRRPSGWAAVDWENSGWGDPAYEIADMMAHPRYIGVAPERWRWVQAHYAELTGDKTAVERIQITYPLTLVWWVARLARVLYERPLGKDRRLATPDPEWQAKTHALLEQYVERVMDVG